jgi:hypothetical protein
MVDAARRTGLCVEHYLDTIRPVEAVKPPPRWPVRTVIVPQFGVDGYRYRSVSLPREPWHEEETTMTKLEALIELRDAVTANRPYEHQCAIDAGFPYGHTSAALRGSLSDAYELHMHLTPTWAWDVSCNGEVTLWAPGTLKDDRDFVVGISRTPARAWLLAILSALIAQEEAA